MAGSIEELYQEYRSRLEDVDTIERELLETDDKESWTEKLVKKSELLRSFYRDTEEDLKQYILPILEGEEKLTSDSANALYDGAFSFYMNVLSDDILGSQMFVKLWEYYHSVGDEYKERNCRFAFADTPFANVEGNVHRMAEEQNDWVSSYINRIEELREAHDDDEKFYEEVKHVMESIRKQYYMESVKYEPDVNELIRCFNRLHRIFHYRDYFSGELWESLEKQYDETGTDVLFIAAMHWNRVKPELQKQLMETYPAAFLLQSRLPMKERNLKAYAGYLVYAFYSGTLKPRETFALLRAYGKSMTNDYDFNSPNWFSQPSDSRFAFYCHALKPMLEMLQAAEIGIEKKNRIKAGLLYELKLYIETIPRECTCKEYLDQALYHMLYDLIPFIDDEAQALELVDTMIISRQLATLIHTVMTAKLSKRITASALRNKPELFMEATHLSSADEVFANRDRILLRAYNGAKTHDIGKLLISNIINMQIRRLSDNEHSYIKYHPKWSYDILKRNAALSIYADVALGHHCSFDGKSGYPEDFDTTKSDQKIFIDILTIADCLDAATDMLGRNYASGKQFSEVIQEMKERAGTQYNPDLVELFEKDSELYLEMEEETSAPARIETYYHIYRTYR